MTDKRSKMLWISPYPIAPPYTGGQIRTFYLIKQLADRFDIILVCAKTPSAAMPRAVKYLKALHQVRIVQLDASIPKIFRWANPLGQYCGPLSSWHDALDRIMRSAAPSTVVLEYSLNAETLGYLKAAHPFAKYILNMHNIESLAVKRYASLSRSGFARSLMIGHLQDKIEKLESCLYKFTDKVWCCSSYDAGILKSMNRHGEADIEIIPNGADVKSFSCDKSAGKYGSRRIIFVGTLRYAPVEDAIIWFYKQVWPILIKDIPDMRFRIVGSAPSARLKHALSTDTGVELVSGVPDVRPHYDESAVSVCPILSASGTRIKIIESMASGTPVVSTTIGAEGLEAISGRHIIIADQPKDFADAIKGLFSDHERYEKIRQNGRLMAETQYDWGVISKAACRSIDCMVGGVRPEGPAEVPPGYA